MKFVRLSVAAAVLVSSTLFAQHSSAGSGSHSSASSSSSSHSNSSHTSVPASHSTPTAPTHPTSSPSPSAPKNTTVKTEPTESTVTEDAAKRVLPPGEPAEKAEPKETSDLRRHVLCNGKPCVLQGGTEHQQENLRHHICLKGPCTVCPSGAPAGKNGACTSAPTNTAVTPKACPVGQVWNGATCTVTGVHCPAGQVANGNSCRADCSLVTGQSGNLITELRSARQEKDQACMQAPGSAQCQQADAQYSGALERYRMLLAGAPVECRTSLPDPISI